MAEATVLIVPGLRDHVAEHWQTLLAAKLPRVRSVPPIGRADLDCQRRIEAIERELVGIEGPVVLVAHSGGVITVVHWATRYGSRSIRGALLAAPPDFERAMPEGYPTLSDLAEAGWLPVPRNPLPFRSIVAASRNDPLGSFDRVAELAQAWGSKLVDIGDAGHLNPASGFGEWPLANTLIGELAGAARSPAAA